MIKQMINHKFENNIEIKYCPIGCSVSKLRLYLENQFNENMNWNNYGSYWHIDHIIPCDAFDLSIPMQQKECFNYLNLQPLEARENQRKSNKYADKYF